MRAVLQRISKAQLLVEGKVHASCGRGLLVLVGFERGDTEQLAKGLVDRILTLRIFPDDKGKMARSLVEENGELLLVSNFTLCGELQKGTRPDFSRAMARKEAELLFHRTFNYARSVYPRLSSGVFGAMMEICATLDGPVTLILEAS
jgi:D-tyrosyl-tRNA(Tyr) deacylase